MTDKFGPLDAGRGEACSNVHPQHGFTCPGCYTDFVFTGAEVDANQFVRCPNPECKAPLRLEIEMVPNYRAAIAEEYEENEIFEEIVV